jgi:hypothetical protein
MKQTVMRVVALAAAFLVAVVFTGTAGAVQGSDANATATGKGVSDVYLVVLEEAPVAAYEGGVAGYRATKPAPGQKLDKRAANVARYAGYLRSRHDAVANGVGAARIYDYSYSLNGFAATLSKGQVARLQASRGVVSVERDSLSQPATDIPQPSSVSTRAVGSGASSADRPARARTSSSGSWTPASGPSTRASPTPAMVPRPPAGTVSASPGSSGRRETAPTS